MTLKQISVFFLCLSYCLFFHSCIKEDLSKLSNDVEWKPNYSLQLATKKFDVAKFNGSLSFLETYKYYGVVTISDTIDFDFSEIFSEKDYLEQLMFRFHILNRFPGRLEIYSDYLDGNGNVVNSVFEIPPLDVSAPIIDSEGEVKEGSQLIHDEYVSQDNFTSLETVKHILIKILIYDLNVSPEVVRQMEEYNVEVEVGVRAYLNIPIE